MKYQPPFVYGDTPGAPGIHNVDPDAAYVNGDPSIGQEGSAIPCEAIEHVHRELVHLIAYSQQTPSHTDLEQVRKAIQWFIDDIFIRTSVTKTVYGVGADFATLSAAMDWVSKKIITKDGFVTFSLAAGKHTVADTAVIVNHPSADRIAIQGAALAGAVSNATLAVTGVNIGGDKAAQLATLRAIYGTEIAFTGAGGFLHLQNGKTLLTRLLITGDGSAPAEGALVMCEDSIVVDQVSVHGSGGHGTIVRSGMFYQLGPYSVSGCAVGHAVSDGAAHIQGAPLRFASCSAAGLALVGGSIRYLSGTGATFYVGGCGDGIFATNFGAALLGSAGAVITYNTYGAHANFGSIKFEGAGVSIINATIGVVCIAGFCGVPGAAFSGTGTAITAQHGGAVNAVAATGAGTTTPANNTIGNQNSYISV